MNNKNSPLVSIVTPSYNQWQFIEDTILSVKNQDYPNIEHIIVDGGSTDDTVETLRKYEGTYNMRWISEPDEGQADAVNKGFAMAKGEIIGWLNSDDVYLLRNTVSSVVGKFRQSPEVAILYGHGVKFSNNKVLRARYLPGFDYETLKCWCFIIQPAVFFKRTVVENDLLRKDLHYSMDYEYWLRLGLRYRWSRLNLVLAGDRNHPERKIIKSRDSSAEETERIRMMMEGCSRTKHIRVFLQKVLGRLGGIVLLWELYRRKNDFTIPIYFASPLKLLHTQLFGKDHSLLV